MREAANCEGEGGGGGTTPPPAIPPYPGSIIRQGTSGESVRLIQQAINRLAPFYPGRLWIIAEDGNFEAMTRDAIFSFQSIFGLTIDGLVGPITWDRLMREAANVAAMSMGYAAPRRVPAGWRSW
jgi:peptidoglycan hydrolase-like protein with peptidoglycan-binding domain